jgi:preprotein translocase subunit YajC
VPPELQFVVFLVALVALWFVITLPSRRAQRQAAEFRSEISVGDEVMMTAGIFGTVRGIENDKARLEIADGTVITVARQALIQRTPDVVDDTAPETTEE